jgi:hypothetical protein
MNIQNRTGHSEVANIAFQVVTIAVIAVFSVLAVLRAAAIIA